MLPGSAAYAFDLSSSIDAGSWYGTLLQGVFDLTPAMTWLQVIGYGGYLAVVMTLFVRGVRATAPKQPVPDKAASAPKAQDAPPARRRPAWVVPVAVVDPSVRPLPLEMSVFRGQMPVGWGQALTFGVLLVLSVLIVFAFFQRWFVQGVGSSAVKG
ncbi:hypothetical protein [Streptomyces guryensis]|uniref:hypothetical protein n=1 Tax=Streptomyces guryensis TaxID=2886947 RepID=UPI003557F1D0